MTNTYKIVEGRLEVSEVNTHTRTKEDLEYEEAQQEIDLAKTREMLSHFK